MREPIYKGATRPAMKWGVPLMALIALYMPVIVITAWLAILVAWQFAAVALVVLVPLYFWMRYVTAKDDQRLMQMIMSIRLARMNPNRAFWKARSYTYYRGRGARNVWR